MFYYIEELCPICRTGLIGFRMCSDNKTIALLCDECGSVWLNFEEISVESALFPESPEYYVEQLQSSLALSTGAKWATKDEIDTAGFTNLIAGESDSISD
ncbi:MAG: hypothetical protein CME33_25605 [Gimesia sp.]|uniref:hypothetical protein n=1 Tax=Gimesia sp. TaxID=2024833 RepID=UPI000C4F3856|nr:hypothetical protein [Gimesia sp.]MAX39934.1 hypothetical protein [Gimesia sp.]|tara:strand:- start:16612 stop:16911 length:300 start_codon:yes stop_codon:yes gene_type:complete